MVTRKHLLENCGRYGLAKKCKSKAKTKNNVKAIVIVLFQNHVTVLINRGPNVAKAQRKEQNFQDG